MIFTKSKEKKGEKIKEIKKERIFKNFSLIFFINFSILKEKRKKILFFFLFTFSFLSINKNYRKLMSNNTQTNILP